MSNRFNLESVNLLALIKDDSEKYIFLYSDKNIAETIRVLERFARNEELSFTRYDCRCFKSENSTN